MKAQETAKYRLLAVDCCDELVDAIKSRALGGCISAVLRASVIPGNAPAPGAANGNHRRLPGKASPHPKEVFHAPGLFPRPA